MEIGDLDNVKKPVKVDYTDPLQYLNDLELYALYKSQESELLKNYYIELFFAWMGSSKTVPKVLKQLHEILLKEKRS